MKTTELRHSDVVRLDHVSYSGLVQAQMPLLERLAAFKARIDHEARSSLSIDEIKACLQVDRLFLERHLSPTHIGDAVPGTTTNLLVRARLATVDWLSIAPPSSATTRLPSSVCTQIAHSLDLRDRVSLSQATRTFRNSLLSEPTLWSRLSIPVSLDYSDAAIWKHAAGLLLRSRATALRSAPSLHLSAVQCINQVLDPSAIDTLDCLFASATTFSINFIFSYMNGSEGRWEQAATMWRLLCQEAPLLRHLSFAVPRLNSVTGSTCLPREFLGARAGQLRSLSLQNVDLLNNIDYPAFSGLREFNYMASVNNAVNPLSSSSLQGILENMPQLEHFGMANFVFVLDALQPTLRHQCLAGVTAEYIWDGLDDLIRFFSCVPRVRYNDSHGTGRALFDQWPVGDINISLFAGRVIARPDTLDPVYTLGIWESSHGTPSEGAIRTIIIPTAHAERVVSLIMGIEQWDYSYKLPPLPRLCTISIVLINCYNRCRNFGNYWWSVDIPSNDRQPWQTSLDNLREINLYSGVEHSVPGGSALRCHLLPGVYSPVKGCCCSNGYAIALCDVVDLIRSLQLPDGRRLPMLYLHGFDAIVDVDPGLALCELLKLVDQVEAGDNILPEDFRVTEQVTSGKILGETKMSRAMEAIFDGMEIPFPSG